MSSDRVTLREVLRRMLDAMAFANAGNRREFLELLSLSKRPPEADAVTPEAAQAQTRSEPSIRLPAHDGTPLPG